MNVITLQDVKQNLFHLVGIGGIGMSGVAILLKKLGASVQGSDKIYTNNCKRLEEDGIKVFVPHKQENVEGVDYLVVSSSIKDDNPELLQAKKLGIKILHRFDILAMLSR